MSHESPEDRVRHRECGGAGRSRLRHLFFSLILVFGSLSISAVAGEVILRLLGHHGAARSFITNIHPVDDPILDWRYNPKSELKIGKIVYTFNSAGFRDVEHVVEKRPGVSRILVLGDSVTEGTGVASDSVFSRRLQAGLGATFEVITIAAAGLNTPQEIHLLEQTGLSYQPDLVVLNFILNDCDFYTRYAAARRYMENKDTRIDVLNLPVYPWFKQLLKSSALIYFVRERADNLKARILHTDNRDYFTKIWSFESNRRKVSGGFDELARLTQRGGFDVVVIVWPLVAAYEDYKFAVIHDWVKKQAEDRGFRTIDLLPAFSRVSYRTLQVAAEDNVHPNALGHKIAAEEFLAWYRSRK